MQTKIIENQIESPDQISPQEVSTALTSAIANSISNSADDAVVFYSLSRLNTKLQALSAAFPANTLHAVAVKANPVVEILKRIQTLGHGAEVASMGELSLALAAGFTADTIIFDSPVKAQSDLEVALKQNVWINANTLEELELIIKLRPLPRIHHQ